ncbi:Uncharacterized protein TCM_005562 [Theobroma cacao]|uniref:Uncharacterized protein n=1 Tax=Theobroma cacao TaxID=3641 RepID=A0A061DU25_THECC|nr:Uncharacterized protein TCM_005562 [Theobroma cacao]
MEKRTAEGTSCETPLVFNGRERSVRRSRTRLSRTETVKHTSTRKLHNSFLITRHITLSSFTSCQVLLQFVALLAVLDEHQYWVSFRLLHESEDNASCLLGFVRDVGNVRILELKRPRTSSPTETWHQSSSYSFRLMMNF